MWSSVDRAVTQDHVVGLSGKVTKECHRGLLVYVYTLSCVQESKIMTHVSMFVWRFQDGQCIA